MVVAKLGFDLDQEAAVECPDLPRRSRSAMAPKSRCSDSAHHRSREPSQRLRSGRPSRLATD